MENEQVNISGAVSNKEQKPHVVAKRANIAFIVILAMLGVAAFLSSGAIGKDGATLVGTLVGVALPICLAVMPFYFAYVALDAGDAKSILRAVKANIAFIIVIALLYFAMVVFGGEGAGTAIIVALMLSLPAISNVKVLMGVRR